MKLVLRTFIFLLNGASYIYSLNSAVFVTELSGGPKSHQTSEVSVLSSSPLTSSPLTSSPKSAPRLFISSSDSETPKLVLRPYKSRIGTVQIDERYEPCIREDLFNIRDDNVRKHVDFFERIDDEDEIFRGPVGKEKTSALIDVFENQEEFGYQKTQSPTLEALRNGKFPRERFIVEEPVNEKEAPSRNVVLRMVEDYERVPNAPEPIPGKLFVAKITEDIEKRTFPIEVNDISVSKVVVPSLVQQWENIVSEKGKGGLRGGKVGSYTFKELFADLASKCDERCLQPVVEANHPIEVTVHSKTLEKSELVQTTFQGTSTDKDEAINAAMLAASQVTGKTYTLDDVKLFVIKG